MGPAVIMDQFPSLDIVSWSRTQFPFEKSRLVKGKKEKEIVEQELAVVHRYPLQATQVFQSALSQARMVLALHALCDELPRLTRYVTMHPAAGDSVLVRILLKPKRVVANCDISAEKPLLLLPMTTSFSECPPDACAFLKTGHLARESSENIMVLGPTFSDPLGVASGKEGVVEPFWLVRREKREQEKCNMILVDSDVIIVTSSNLKGERMKAQRAPAAPIKVMVSPNAIAKGEELVSYFADEGRPRKRAKNKNQSLCDEEVVTVSQSVEAPTPADGKIVEE